MARGRRNVPPSTTDGIWFQHRGASSAGSLRRNDSTSTGMMLSGPFKPCSAGMPRPPPEPFLTRNSINYRSTNRFSEHDNRHAFQDHGVYFGDIYSTHNVRPEWMGLPAIVGRENRNLGRHLLEPGLRHHHTESTFYKHFGRDHIDSDFHTSYQNSYQGKDIQKSERPRFRRFNKSLVQSEPGTIPLDTTTTKWMPTDEPEHKTTTQVLAVSQEPFLRHNAWKFSYNSKRNVYPPYERRSDPIIDNMFNKYGAAFTTTRSSALAASGRS